jgi:hypothetical protein
VLVNDLRVRSDAGLSGAPVAVLQAGEVVSITDEPVQADGSDWYGIQHGSPDPASSFGWVSAGPPDQPYLDLRTAVPVNVPAAVNGLSGGPPGYVAWGLDANRSDEPESRFMVFSADGASWQRAPLPSAMTDWIAAVAWGPSGWIAVTDANAAEAAPGTFWLSTNGLCWRPLPLLDIPGIIPTSVAGSTAGYVLTVGDGRSGNGTQTLFFSSDGLDWEEIGPPLPQPTNSGVMTLEPGFMQWAASQEATAIRLSTDGRVWRDAGGTSLPPSVNKPPLFASADGWLVAVTTDLQTGVHAIWRAPLGGSDLVWERQTEAEAIVADNTIMSLASDGSTVLAVGYEPTRGELRMWGTSDGAAWSAAPTDDLFGGLVPPFAVGAQGGFVAVGQSLTEAGSNPVMWHGDGPLAWTPEADPVLGTIETPVVGSCPDLPNAMVDWLAVPFPVAAACFGEAPITFRGWLTAAGGCGGLRPGTYEPAWLAGNFSRIAIVLAPYETPYYDCGSAAQPPTLTQLPAKQRWVVITGHYNDPASESCRFTPTPTYKGAGPGQASLDLYCRQVFVATSVVPEGP